MRLSLLTIALGLHAATSSDALKPDIMSGGDWSGKDSILVALGNVMEGEVVHRALVDALRDGRLDEREFLESTKRVMEVRRKIARGRGF